MFTNMHLRYFASLMLVCLLEPYLVVLTGFGAGILSVNVISSLFDNLNYVLIVGMIYFTCIYVAWIIFLFQKGFESIVLSEFPLYAYGPLYFISLVVEYTFSWVSRFDLLLYWLLPLAIGLIRIAILFSLRFDANLSVDIDSGAVTFTIKKERKIIRWHEIDKILYSGVLLLRNNQQYRLWHSFHKQLDYALYAYPNFFLVKHEMMRMFKYFHSQNMDGVKTHDNYNT